MALFSPDLTAFGDEAGFARWLTAHYLEHQQFVQLGLLNTPVLFFPNWDFWYFGDNKGAQETWISSHAVTHQILCATVKVSGFDFSGLDVERPDRFALWMEAHRTEHEKLRTAFGIT
jgi:hypothetical protein